MTAIIIPEKIDWELLRKQKATVVEIASSHNVTAEQRADLNGIIGLIDSFQDTAVSLGGCSSEEVFGKQEGG